MYADSRYDKHGQQLAATVSRQAHHRQMHIQRRTEQGTALKRIALALLCLSLSPLLYAQSVYIGDNLRVGVRSEPGTNTAPTKVITSGTAITILQKNANYVRIRTEDGIEGWIRDDYISTTPPARALLNEMEKSRSKAHQELGVANNKIQELSQKIELLNSEIYTLHQQLSTLRPGSNKAWVYMIIATISLCGLSFTLGILWNKHQVAKKLGGHTL